MSDKDYTLASCVGFLKKSGYRFVSKMFTKNGKFIYLAQMLHLPKASSEAVFQVKADGRIYKNVGNYYSLWFAPNMRFFEESLLNTKESHNGTKGEQ